MLWHSSAPSLSRLFTGSARQRVCEKQTLQTPCCFLLRQFPPRVAFVTRPSTTRDAPKRERAKKLERDCKAEESRISSVVSGWAWYRHYVERMGVLAPLTKSGSWPPLMLGDRHRCAVAISVLGELRVGFSGSLERRRVRRRSCPQAEFFTRTASSRCGRDIRGKQCCGRVGERVAIAWPPAPWRRVGLIEGPRYCLVQTVMQQQSALTAASPIQSGPRIAAHRRSQFAMAIWVRG